MNKTRAKAIKLYWNIAKERCPFHEKEIVNGFLEGFIDCAEYLLLQITDLKKENAELKNERNAFKIYSDGAELDAINLNEQLAKAKVALRNVIDYLGQFCSDYPDCVIEAEQFLKDSEVEK